LTVRRLADVGCAAPTVVDDAGSAELSAAALDGVAFPGVIVWVWS
jgi:hypothetical protein